MSIAVITGASSGLGMKFADHIAALFPEVDELWLTARRADRLEAYAADAGLKAVPLPLDLTDERDVNALARRLHERDSEVALLINCAGCGYLGDVAELDRTLMERCIDLNVRALTSVTAAVLPYMADGGRIVNVSSIASFCPNPRMTVYASTKAYVTSFSLGLRDELRERHINVTAVCPGPMDTEFLDVGNIKGNSPMFASLPYCDPDKVARGALKAARAGRAVYTPTAFYKFYRFAAKIVPHSLLVKMVRT